MTTFITILMFIFGTIMGSFLNVVALRWNTGKTALSGRSKCVNCNKTLHSHELIPLFSFIFQRGKCRGCKSRLSFQYPLVEFLTGVVYAGIFLSIGGMFMAEPFYLFLSLAYFCTIASILIVIGIYDTHHKIVPNELVYSFIAISFFGMFLTRDVTLVWDILAGPIVALPFFLIWIFSKGRLMGFGDIKIIFGIGFFLGLYGAIAGVLISFWIGAIFVLFFAILRRAKVTFGTEIPFAPFLIVGTLIALLFSVDITDIISLLTFY